MEVLDSDQPLIKHDPHVHRLKQSKLVTTRIVDDTADRLVGKVHDGSIDQDIQITGTDGRRRVRKLGFEDLVYDFRKHLTCSVKDFIVCISGLYHQIQMRYEHDHVADEFGATARERKGLTREKGSVQRLDEHARAWKPIDQNLR